MLKLVPFHSEWINNHKIDIHAIYRRPRYKEDEFGEWHRELDTDGLPTWDLTGPLPVKSHNRWVSKGFEYVTLANRESLAVAARTGTLTDGTFRDYDQHQTGGPWNYRKYLAGQAQAHTADAEKLRADVERFGAEAVEAIRQQTEPSFRLPDEFKKPKVKAKPEAKAEAAAT